MKTSVNIAVSSRALFDLSEMHQLFLKNKEEYEKFQIENCDIPLEKGHAFNFIQKLYNLEKKEGVEITVMVISQNSMSTGERIMNSCKHHGLDIDRFVFTSGDNPAPYITSDSLNITLFLSHCEDSVRWALNAGIPSAIIMSGAKTDSDEIRIAFDGDAVIFSDESEKMYQEHGLDAFRQHENDKRHIPLSPGPFKKTFADLVALQNAYPDKIKIGLFTARGGESAERVKLSFKHWNLYPQHGAFLKGARKSTFLEAFKADIFFDDHPKHCKEAMDTVTTAHVPNKITTPAN